MPSRKEKAQRAKLFLPFDSLKGFQEYLRKKEKIVVEKKQLSQEDCEVINHQLQLLRKGMMVKIVYFKDQEYIELEGMVSKIDLEYTKILQIVNQKIPICDIMAINLYDTGKEMTVC